MFGPPTPEDLRRVLPAVSMPLLAKLGSSGGWLVARLVGETRETAPETEPEAGSAAVDLGIMGPGLSEAAAGARALLIRLWVGDGEGEL
jgi:hypothetical protein